MPLADLVAEQLAADLLDVEASLVAYRELAQVAIHELHDVQQHIVSLQAQLSALRDEIRRYTASRVMVES